MALDFEKPILFIDLSYYVFYRYYALVNWYKLSQETPFDVDALESNELFLTKYKKMFLEHLGKLKRKLGVSDSNVVFARDCPRETIWRNDLYSEYKGTRADKPRDFNGHIFKYTYDVVMPCVCEAGCLLLGEDRAEADDIIGILVHKIRAEHERVPIHVITGDMDYLQLAGPNTHLQNLRGADLTAKSQGCAQTDMMLKIIVGDASDNIAPVFSKLSKAKALVLAKDSVALNAALEAGGPEVQARFERNQTLVDFRRIPLAYKQKIETLITAI